MAAFVADASVTLAWCFADETTPYTEAVLNRLRVGEEAVVPSHWPLEVLNGLILAKRRRRIDEAAVQAALTNLLSLRIAIDAGSLFSSRAAIIELAERHRLTAYDAAYLELSKRRRLPLATLDQQLLAAVRAEGIPAI
jgi:predicted nucleic acid-binding protein